VERFPETGKVSKISKKGGKVSGDWKGLKLQRQVERFLGENFKERRVKIFTKKERKIFTK